MRPKKSLKNSINKPRTVPLKKIKQKVREKKKALKGETLPHSG